MQLAIAVLVIGLLIGSPAGFAPGSNENLDILGFGLVGEQGLTIYVTLLACVGAAFFMMIKIISRGTIWTRPIQYSY